MQTSTSTLTLIETNVDGHAPEFRHFGDHDAAASCGVVLCSAPCSVRPGLRAWVVPDTPGVLAADGKLRNASDCVCSRAMAQ